VLQREVRGSRQCSPTRAKRHSPALWLIGKRSTVGSLRQSSPGARGARIPTTETPPIALSLGDPRARERRGGWWTRVLEVGTDRWALDVAIEHRLRIRGQGVAGARQAPEPEGQIGVRDVPVVELAGRSEPHHEIDELARVALGLDG